MRAYRALMLSKCAHACMHACMHAGSPAHCIQSLVDPFLMQANAVLLKSLVDQAVGASPDQLASILSPLMENAHMLPETLSVHLVPHIQQYW
jgi:hypothetical protein